MLNGELSQLQAGFLSGRQPGEHIRVVQDSWCAFRKQRKAAVWLFLDFQKAYDRVSWRWLHQVVARWQPGNTFLKWMKALYPMEGGEGGLWRKLFLQLGWSDVFRIHTGVAQGCPLSPFLFNMVVDPWVRAMEQDAAWEGIPLSNLSYA